MRRVWPSRLLLAASLLWALAGAEDGMKSPEQQLTLKYHNLLRQYISFGYYGKGETDFGYPTGANMNALVWDETLAAGAQEWAEGCEFDHDKRKVEERFGENLAALAIKDTEDERRASLIKGLRLWKDEMKAKPVEDGDLSYKSENLLETGHFTQMVWAATTKMGCGMQDCPDKKFNLLVCRYSPPGNIKGKTIYEPGYPCDACEAGCDTSTNLCGDGSGDGGVTGAPNVDGNSTTESLELEESTVEGGYTVPMPFANATGADGGEGEAPSGATDAPGASTTAGEGDGASGPTEATTTAGAEGGTTEAGAGEEGETTETSGEGTTVQGDESSGATEAPSDEGGSTEAPGDAEGTTLAGDESSSLPPPEEEPPPPDAPEGPEGTSDEPEGASTASPEDGASEGTTEASDSDPEATTGDGGTEDGDPESTADGEDGATEATTDASGTLANETLISLLDNATAANETEGEEGGPTPIVIASEGDMEEALNATADSLNATLANATGEAGAAGEEAEEALEEQPEASLKESDTPVGEETAFPGTISRLQEEEAAPTLVASTIFEVEGEAPQNRQSSLDFEVEDPEELTGAEVLEILTEAKVAPSPLPNSERVPKRA